MMNEKFIFCKHNGECRNPNKIVCPIEEGYGYAILVAQKANGKWVYGYEVQCNYLRTACPCCAWGGDQSPEYDTEDGAISAAAGQVVRMLRKFKGKCGNMVALVEMQDAAEDLMVIDEYK